MTFGRFLLLLLAALFAIGAIPLLRFVDWRTQRLNALRQPSSVVRTELGFVEYAQQPGEGTPVVILHGAVGGYDQGLFFAKTLLPEGRRVIALSRPGYLRTPISSGVFPEQQADLAASLILQLAAGPVDVLAANEAAACALHLALRHPALVRRVVLISPIILRTAPDPDGAPSLPAEALLRLVSGDISAWLTDFWLNWNPAGFIERWLATETNLRPYPAAKLAESLAKQPESIGLLRDFLQTIAPISPRETGTRNDIVQMRGLPEIAFADVAVPVLVVNGENSAFPLNEAATGAIAKIPRVQIVTVPADGCILPGFAGGSAAAREAISAFLE